MVNIIHNYDVDRIYFDKIKKYFKEVTSSFSNENYRSANVMLYSIAITDILFKLRELVDSYDDGIAKEIIENLSEEKEFIYEHSGKWESELIEVVKRDTQLLNNHAYANLSTLRNIRNLSAHPALDENYELIMPTKEETIANINNIYRNILIKPPVFLKDITDKIISDTEAKKSIYLNDKKQFSKYLNDNYFIHMTDKMISKVFRVFWKFCFKLPEDEKCIENRDINTILLEIIYDKKPDIILETINEEISYYNISPNKGCMSYAIKLFSIMPNIYHNLHENIQYEIKSYTKNGDEYTLVSWFTKKDRISHLKDLRLVHDDYSYTEISIVHSIDSYETIGQLDILIDYLIDYFLNSSSYNMADKRFDQAIRPILEKLTASNFINLIEGIVNNPQIYGRARSKRDNNLIVEYSIDKLGHDFEYCDYTNFEYDDFVLSDGSPSFIPF